MSSDEKYEYELKKREETIASREKDLAINANKVECLKIMSDKGIDSSLVEFIVTEDATEMNERIATFERIINNAVAKEVASRINSGTPTTHGTASGVLTKESFKKLSIVEQSRIANESPELYKELTAR